MSTSPPPPDPAHCTSGPCSSILFCFHRMKSLEQDALRAQMVLSKSQEGRGKRGPLERLAEAPSPAPTPSPTPLEGMCFHGPAKGSSCSEHFSQHSLLVPPDFSLQTSTSPGRLVRILCLGPFHTPRGLTLRGSRLPTSLTSLALSCLSLHAVLSSLYLERSLTTGPSQPCLLPDLSMTSRYWRLLGPFSMFLPPLCLSRALLYPFLCVSCSVSCLWGLPTQLGLGPVCSDPVPGSVGLPPDSQASVCKCRQA